MDNGRGRLHDTNLASDLLGYLAAKIAGGLFVWRLQNEHAAPSFSLTSEFHCGVVRSRYRLPMTQERRWNFVSAVALVVVAAAWLWFLFAYADLIFRH